MNAVSRFEALYEAHYRHVLAYARRRVDENTARDLTAETFAIAWRRLDVVPHEEPLAWLYATARRVLANELRNERYRQQLTLRAQAAVLAGVPTVLDHAEQIAARDEIAQAMARLSPRDQEALQLSSWEDLDPTTAAEVTGCSTTAFKVRLHRARRRLRDALRSTDGGDEGGDAGNSDEGNDTRSVPGPLSASTSSRARPATPSAPSTHSATSSPRSASTDTSLRGERPRTHPLESHR